MISEKQIIDQLKVKIHDLLPAKGLNVRFEIEQSVAGKEAKPDILLGISFKGQKIYFAGEVISNPNYPVIRNKIAKIKNIAAEKVNLRPLLISPYLSPDKRKECRKAGVYYLDLSGNVYLEHEGLYVEREGFPNLFPEKRMGRNPFSDKASLILRAMLMDNSRQWGVRELAEAVELNPGYVSRMVSELESRGYVILRDGKFSLRDPKSLLDDWVSAYDYNKNRQRRFFCLAKSPEEVLNKIRKARLPGDAHYGLGLQAGANLVAPYTVYNEVHLYIHDHRVVDSFIKQLSLDEVSQGANVIILDPYYKNSVFFGLREAEGLWVVSDIQLYLDLYRYPLRGREQAEHLYEKSLKKVIEGSDPHE